MQATAGFQIRVDDFIYFWIETNFIEYNQIYHNGNWLGNMNTLFGVNKETLTRAGFESATIGLMCRHCTTRVI